MLLFGKYRAITALNLALLSSFPCSAQEPVAEKSATSPQNTVVDFRNARTILPALETKVSFEVKSQPLPQLVAELSRQSKVALSIAENFAADDLLVTARVKQMALMDVMRSLSRIYGIAWTGSGNNFVMDKNSLPPFGRELLKLGHVGIIENGRLLQRRITPPPKWMREVMAELGEDNLTTPQGVPMERLSGALRDRLRATVLETQSFGLLSIYQKLFHGPDDRSIIKTVRLRNERLSVMRRFPIDGPDRWSVIVESDPVLFVGHRGAELGRFPLFEATSP
ncbi:MAG: hypothetical protein JWN98_395 [Abditibacteriota bacterium]|nr:hypothetical protein [Abditibacteriota bacterium]